MFIFNNIIDNNYVFYSLFTTTAGLITYLVIKSYLNSSVIETPNSPQTFYFTPDQMSKIKDILDNEEEYETPNFPLKITTEQNKELQDILDNEGDLDEYLKQILTTEEYDQYKAELLNPDNDFSENLQDIFDNFDIF